MSFQDMEIVPLSEEDTESGVFINIKINGSQLKLQKCQSCENVHVYGVDLELFTYRFDYVYQHSDTRKDMIAKITQEYVNQQSLLYMEQKQAFRQAGRCVKH